MNKVYLIAGRTGGPFFPLPAVVKSLSNIEPICIGVKNGFEETASHKRGWKIRYLPETRLTLLSFKTEKISETVKNYSDLFKNFILLAWSFLKCVYFLVLDKPKMIYSTGSFLAVPIIYAAEITNFFRLTTTKIIIHQQDPQPGLSNKLTVSKANLVSYVYNYTKLNYSKFKNAIQIPNPIEEEKYNKLSLLTQDKLIEQAKNLELQKFLKIKNSNPLMLIFGGGSGSEDINVWTINNIDELLKKFRIIHLTGLLQTKQLGDVKNVNYLRLEVLFEEMPIVMKLADLVLCRAGMASITELQYLEKPAYLVPLPSTHQEENAKMVESLFYILHQSNRPSWLNTISKTYPAYFDQVTFPSKDIAQSKLKKYYKTLQDMLDN
ncbi:MAG: UDP-N-acetylglucosamine--N-acetylmuramyl-(pentapeptide) pyrophosphoryl-undecaprenol N-acetylglucosamine transferase [Patescibacteria group bacterium]